MKTARILALRSKHRLAELPPRLPVGSCLTHDLEGCTIATIGLPDLIQVALRKLGRSIPSFIYVLLPQGSVRSAEDSSFKSPAVIQMFEMFHQGNNVINQFLARLGFGEPGISGIIVLGRPPCMGVSSPRPDWGVFPREGN